MHVRTGLTLPGAWAIHFVLILVGKIFFDIIPGMSQETSWTLVNLSYMAGSYLMFHYVRGVPFDFNAGAYDNLNMWEQIDNGDQYTPAKKFLLSVPILLFLVSTHYTHYDLTYFIINFMATMAVVIPKLPSVCHIHSPDHGKTDMPTVTPTAIRLFQQPTRRCVERLSFPRLHYLEWCNFACITRNCHIGRAQIE